MNIAPMGLRALALSLVFGVAALPSHSQERQIHKGGTTTPHAGPMGTTADGRNEVDTQLYGIGDANNAAAVGSQASGSTSVNRQMKNGRHGYGDRTEGRGEREDHLAVKATFDGLNFHDQRFANNGNQFSVEPPDQGLCVGNGFLLESVNDVLRIFDTNGHPLSGVIDLNTFYGYPPAIDRTANPITRGPEITDPSCFFDRATQRFFHIVLTLDRVSPTNPALTGTNHLDLAVSNTSSPLGSWTIYRIPVQDDGTGGTPNHHCAGGPCLGDFPHIGADRFGIYLTTNEFPFFAPGFHGAQVYAISKQALAHAAPIIEVFEFDTGDPAFKSATGFPGFAVIPAYPSEKNDHVWLSDEEREGTEYLLSSTAVFTKSGVDTQVQLWAFTDTNNLASGKAPLFLNARVPTEAYGVPNAARQPGSGTNGVGKKPGGGNVDWPLGQCLNDPTCAVPNLLPAPDPFKEVISFLDGDDSRMKQVYFADGKVWGALGTGSTFRGNLPPSVGIAYFIIDPKATDTTLSGKVVNQGYIATPKADLTYPTFGVTSEGKAVITFTLTGPNNFPSLGYAHVDQYRGAGDIHIAKRGIGAQDGFTGYFGEANLGTPTNPVIRPRWGDFGSSAVVGNQVFAGQEYIGQSCTLAEYREAENPFGTCDGTRAALGNWGTRIVRFSTVENEN
jgi:hypothetical protein